MATPDERLDDLLERVERLERRGLGLFQQSPEDPNAFVLPKSIGAELLKTDAITADAIAADAVGQSELGPDSVRPDDQAVCAAPGAIQPDDTATEGTAVTFARSDHKHGFTTASATQLDDLNAEGTAATAARSDHGHASPPAVFRTGCQRIIGLIESHTAVTTNDLRITEIIVVKRGTVTGLRYCVGNTASGSVRPGLFDSALDRVANRTTNIVQGTAQQGQQLAFDATYAIVPGIYYGAITATLSTTSFMTAMIGERSDSSNNGSMAIPSTIPAPGISNTLHAVLMSLY